MERLQGSLPPTPWPMACREGRARERDRERQRDINYERERERERETELWARRSCWASSCLGLVLVLVAKKRAGKANRHFSLQWRQVQS